ncbi:DUF6415 family natural product biosynthesis protein [Streptomyces swartbergensis]|uniref:Uncharacterized protein n=1 Tax=Streptomyces swartbergensis TaxID=487165 RepID=A0A243S9M0_9ACTN|nr:DUF6415 family natural product biosynthesis protein [Streptomyces swartbergensis]OUD04361.1 hypothetical protein CA983_04705 [Streptomyces swartbergensis]
MNATHSETEVPVPSITAMRAQAGWFLDQRTLPRHQTTKLMGQDCHGFLEHLIAQVERLASERPKDDVPANVALAAVNEAQIRMNEPEAAGLQGEVERVQRLARSVLSLADHHDHLTGITMCVVCDRVIEAGEESVRHDDASPSCGAARSGRIHPECASRRR